MPDAETAVLAHTCQLVSLHVAELYKPDLVLVCLQRRDALLRYDVSGALMVAKERKFVHVHVVIAARAQLQGEGLLHQRLKALRLQHGV